MEQSAQLRLPLGDGVPLFEQVANAVLDVQALAFRRGGFSVEKKYPTLNEEMCKNDT